MSKYLIFLGGIIAGLVSCKTAVSPSQIITVTNSSQIELKDKAVVIKRETFNNNPQNELFPLIISSAGDTIASQLDDTDRDGSWDQLFFVTDFKACEEKKLTLNWNNSAQISVARSHIRFGVRQTRESRVEKAMSDTFYADQLPGVIGYQHYQTDGPTWENDKVGFRIYLDGRNSIDVFGKTVSYITSDSIGIGRDGYTENNYSEMKSWGTDILGVGNSVGIGGIALQINDSLARLGVTEKDSLNNVDTTIFNIFSNGPVRSLMEYSYKNWKPLDRSYRVKMTSSIWPGMYAFQNTVNMQHLKGDETLIVGLVNSNTTKQVEEISINDRWVALLTHDQQSINKTWWLGLAIIIPKEHYLGYITAPKQGRVSNSYFAKLKISNDQPITYYAVAGWELSDTRFKDSTGFTNYVRDLALQLDAEIKISVK